MGERSEGIPAIATATAVEFIGDNAALKTTMATLEVTSFSSSKSKMSTAGMREFGALNVDRWGNSPLPADSTSSVWSESTSSARRKPSEVVFRDIWRSLDKQDEDFETDNSAYVLGSFSSREKIRANELRGDAVAIMESSSVAKEKAGEANRLRREKVPAGNMPSAAEIEEFFAVTEKYEQKRFLEKYNYDVVKDAPLEGRYQWVRLNNP
ncbi:unnamed protein product [Cuscuta epithymum]|uniref:Cyclin-dependent kinase inhibitor domain-containing protein n=1 Tax=Cuscuta epithymum TaxID=186058 RepID=A0AAV0GDY7_9ASTE|nr:unnamed protein product [Cuscuta epithymum]